jgi:glycerol uptake facilitator protein
MFLGEVVGTAVLILLGDGVVAGVLLNRSKAQNSGWIVITWAWGLAVFMGVLTSVAVTDGVAHLNPAVTLGLAAVDITEWSDVPQLIAGQFLGAFIGATLVWLSYLAHWPETDDPGLKLAVFSTGPAIRNPVANLITEIIGTFMLVFGILATVGADTGEGAWLSTGALPVGLLVGDRHGAGRPDRVRDQPREGPRSSDHALRPADRRQGRLGLGVLVGAGDRPDHRRRDRRPRRRRGLLPVGRGARGSPGGLGTPQERRAV